MKKIFSLLTFVLSFIQISNAQTPKLNNAFNASTGIVVDSKGNAFVTGGNSKIIKITPAGKDNRHQFNTRRLPVRTKSNG